jgi:hypothetical protein
MAKYVEIRIRETGDRLEGGGLEAKGIRRKAQGKDKGDRIYRPPLARR